MRQDNINMLSDTLSILNAGAYNVGGREVPLKLSLAQMRRSQVFLPREIEMLGPETAYCREKTGTPMSVTCQNADSYVVARERAQKRWEQLGEGCANVLVLNLANPVNPGGGVRRGARAQEEDLCRKSSLLLSLEDEAAMPYYQYNRRLHTYMGSDAIIITPEVEIIRDGAGNLLEDSVVVAVITCVAPMLSRRMEGLTDKEYRQMVLHRITGMLRVAAWLGYDALVLGAFGCGAFRNDAAVVSDLFAQAMRTFQFGDRATDQCFRSIDFAVLDHTPSQYNFKQFSRNFASYRVDQT